MKKIFILLVLAFFVANSNAQFFRFPSKKKKSKESSELSESIKDTKQKTFSLFPPLGIEWPEIPLSGSPGSEINNRGIQGLARTKVNRWGSFINEDATRFLEKAVNENNVDKAAKFLKAGASAFITYEMIDKKQYEMIDLMYRDNPKLIRYSQLLHYACAHSDTTMIDFLIAREASLDLCGYYINIDKLGDYSVMCKWNSDYRYPQTPADNAMRTTKWGNLKHIINKYHKNPTVYGCARRLIFLLESASVEIIRNFIFAREPYSFLKDVDNNKYTLSDVINIGFHQLQRAGDKLAPKSYYAINTLVSRIAKIRAKDPNGGKEFVDVLNLLIDNGANVNIMTDNGAYVRRVQSVGINVMSYTNTTPMYIALTNKNMMDIVKLLRSKGASMTTIVNGKKVSILQLGDCLDEYKEYFMIEGQ